MAEVGQRLGSGAYRLSALRTSQSRPVCSGRSLPISRPSVQGPVEDDPVQEQGEVQPVPESRATRRKSEKLSRVVKRESQQDDVTLLCAASLGPAASRLIGFVETRESPLAPATALYFSAGLLREKLLPCRMTPWTRGAVSIDPDTLRSPQQLRAFCTVVFILAEQGPERLGCPRRLGQLKPHREASTTSRSYSRSSSDPPLLHRSKTAYYDILKVSPGATQSQIKTAYYKQSFVYHPDKNPESKEATQRFSEISEAYTVLGNISLRRKYDRGILSQADVRSGWRPSSTEATSRPTGFPHHQPHQHRARRFSQAGGKPIFDFDAFYQAHYGEQLQREKDMRARKQHREGLQKEKQDRWRQRKMIEVAVTALLAMAGMIMVSISRP
ncbi:dnaJ (Hsp40) homolog, subfamily C, member 30b [Embiotoca jacksoni]|uniref:dnaJ (Hsp40) homolog, subfamily C, member 30b n=1 Tax=Embiotoca jacksoni TaxID=100190 RepID=UPI0037040F22